MRRRVPVLLAAAAAALAVPAIMVPAATARPGAAGLPSRLFTPYFETYDTSAGMAALSQASGARFLSLAFLQTDQPGSCTAYWNGSTSTPVAPSSFGADIAAIQAAGGNVIPSFGGFAADTTGTEIADSCTDPAAIARVFENVITTYDVPRIDLDIEGDSVHNAAGIDRRNKAVALTEAWAAANGRAIEFSYTLPTFPGGLPPAELSVLENAAANGARISSVNLLTFDYFTGSAHDMLADTETAATALAGQLAAIYPGLSQAQLWHMIGVVEMPGIDDFGPQETFTLADAPRLVLWARQHGIGTLSFWALQRDNGGCPGAKGAGTCSGLVQPPWFFSHAFELFGGTFPVT